jgi:hypothetical protein
MVLILPAFFIITVAVILLHARKERFLTQYAALAAKGLEHGSSATEEALRPMRELMLTESLRRGILSSVLGAAILAVALLARFAVEPLPGSFLVVVGIIVLALGLGSLIVWLVVDRPRMTPR